MTAPDPAPRPAPSAEGRRLIDDRVKVARETRNHLGLGSEVNHLGAKRREEVADAALSAYVAGLEAEVARLREAGPNDRIDRRTHGDLGDDDAPYLDEVVISNAMIHIEQMTEASYWIGVYRGQDEWRFWINANEEGGIDLACTERPEPTALAQLGADP